MREREERPVREERTVPVHTHCVMCGDKLRKEDEPSDACYLCHAEIYGAAGYS